MIDMSRDRGAVPPQVKDTVVVDTLTPFPPYLRSGPDTPLGLRPPAARV